MCVFLCNSTDASTTLFPFFSIFVSQNDKLFSHSTIPRMHSIISGSHLRHHECIFFNVEKLENAAPYPLYAFPPLPPSDATSPLILSDQLTAANSHPLITQHFVFNWSFQHIFCLHWNRPRGTIQTSLAPLVFPPRILLLGIYFLIFFVASFLSSATLRRCIIQTFIIVLLLVSVQCGFVAIFNRFVRRLTR